MNPNDEEEQEKLRRAAEDLRSATNTAASDALKKKLVKRLEVESFDIEVRIFTRKTISHSSLHGLRNSCDIVFLVKFNFEFPSRS